MDIKYTGGNIVITIPYKKGDGAKAELSGSGKSRLVAKTNSFEVVEGAPDVLKVQVNLISPIPKGERS